MREYALIDNSRPDDLTYPTATPSDTAYNPKPIGAKDENCIAQIGDYIVDRDGDIMIATTSNAGPHGSEFLRRLNEVCVRAKFIGNRDDSLVCANQMRLCTAAEIERAKRYQPTGFKVTSRGQLALL